MDWSPQQEAALADFQRWVRTDDEVFYLAGYAGAGKSTLARELADIMVAMAGGNVLYAAFTGKAAHVMRRKGCPGATTIHKLIYNPREKARVRLRELEKELAELSGEGVQDQMMALRLLIEKEKEDLAQPGFILKEDSEVRGAALVVIDECSMVDERLGRDLLSFGTRVLVLGDPAQLPPVRGTGFFTSRKPDVMLTEIHRQARDNPIIDLATRVRAGEKLEPGQYGASRVADICDVDDEELEKIATTCDQLLVGKNNMRKGMNGRLRELLDLDADGPLPVPGDKLVCLRNDHKIGLLNGEIWYVNDSKQSDSDYIDLVIRPDGGGEELEVKAHVNPFLGYPPPKWGGQTQVFDYGYALTVHKAQGSQWDHVMLIDQSRVFRADAQKHLYTAITRAAESVQVLVL